MARQNVGRARKKQKDYYNKWQRPPRFGVGDQVFLFKPAEKTGEARKLAQPYHGQYRVIELDTNTARVHRTDRPQDEPILVALDRLRRCPMEIGDDCWPPQKKGKRPKKTMPAAPVIVVPPHAHREGAVQSKFVFEDSLDTVLEPLQSEEVPPEIPPMGDVEANTADDPASEGGARSTPLLLQSQVIDTSEPVTMKTVHMKLAPGQDTTTPTTETVVGEGVGGLRGENNGQGVDKEVQKSKKGASGKWAG